MRILLCALLLFLPATSAFAYDILLIAGQDAPVSVLNRTEAANLFLGIGYTAPPLTPFDQKDAQLRERFYRGVAGLSAASVRAHWAKEVFTGRGRPPAMLELEEVENVLKENPFAVTYVPAGEMPKGSKLLLMLESGKEK